VTPQIGPLVDAESVARAALATLSAAFHAQDRDRLVEQFSPEPGATYAGSEVGEIATGRQQLVELFSHLFARPERYRFEFHDIRAASSGSTLWILADGHGHESVAHGEDETFPYRVSGLLVQEFGAWRWVLLSGAEPTPPS
jgi:hypothetical protein